MQYKDVKFIRKKLGNIKRGLIEATLNSLKLS